MIDLKTLREEFSKLHNDTSAVITAAGAEKRSMTAEEKQANVQRYSRMDEIQALVDESTKLAKYSFSADQVERPAAPAGKQEFDAARQADQGGAIKFDADQYRAAVNHFCQTGDQSKLHRFAITTGTASGALLPKGVLPPIEVRRLQNAIRNVMAQYNVPAIKMDVPMAFNLPIGDDTGNIGQQTAEGATTGTTADVSFAGTVTLSGNILWDSKQEWVSNTQLSAVGFDFFSYLQPILMKRLDKAQESAWTTTLKTATTGKTTASGTAITYQEILAWEHSLPPAYRSDGAFIVSDSLYQIVRGLVDSNNRPIFDLDPQNVFQGRLHGKPLAVSDYFETVASGHKSGAFVSAAALKVLDIAEPRIIRYLSDPNHVDQTGFQIVQNGDFAFDPNGVRVLAHT